jgi:AraC family transcriptional regulator, transcriptional activator FtrA
LLESGKQSIEKVAESAGFANAATMRHHFRRMLGVSPRQYQEQFVR